MAFRISGFDSLWLHHIDEDDVPCLERDERL